MVWTTIKEKQPSKFNKQSYLIFFEYFGEIKYSIITRKVLDFLKIPKLEVGQEIQVFKNINSQGKEIFLLRGVK